MKNLDKLNLNKQFKSADEFSQSNATFFSLKYKMLLITISVILVFGISQFIYYHNYLYERINSEEQKYANKVMATIKNAIDFNTSGLVALNKDWAEWDAMYNAVDNWTKSFEEENCPDSVFEELDLNYLFVINRKGKVVYAKSYIPAKVDKVRACKVPEDLLGLFSSDAGIDFSGLVLLEKSPVFFSSKAILHSDMTGPSNGRLIMGRVIDNAFIADIGKIINEDVSFFKGSLPCNCNSNLNCLTLTRSENAISLIFPLLDYLGNKIVHVHVRIRRNLFDILNNSAKLFTILSLVTFLILIIVNTYLVERFTLRRLKIMASVMNEVTYGDSRYLPLIVKGNDEITLLQQSYNNMIERLRVGEKQRKKLEKRLVVMEKMATAGKITYSILHEINNPIRVIKNYLFAMEQGQCEKEYLENIKNEITHLSNITTQLLDFSGQNNIVQEKVNLAKLIDDTIKSVKVAYQDVNYRIDFRANCEDAFIKGHPGKLKQVFFNIMKNAIEACEDSGKIEVNLELQGEMFSVSVRDNGHGINNDQIEKLFEPFYTKNKENGLGLGLSISYNIVKNHGGDIFVDSDVEEGACFIVVLPKLNSGE
jgi:signal transduction histidine kinase